MFQKNIIDEPGAFVEAGIRALRKDNGTRPGDVRFALKLFNGVGPSQAILKFTHHLCVLVLGSARDKIWTQKKIDYALASLGLFYSDDIREVCGETLYRRVVEHAQRKYDDNP